MGKLTTFIIGGVIGAAAGLLLSPRTGAENRALINETIAENCKIPAGVQERACQFVDAAASTSTKVINTVVDGGTDAYKTVAARAQKISPAAQSFVDNGDELREKIDAARERIATQVAKNAEAARDAAVDKVPAAIDAAQSATQAAAGAVSSAKDAAVNAASAVASKVVPGKADAPAEAEAPAASEEPAAGEEAK